MKPSTLTKTAPQPDQVLLDIADYVHDREAFTPEARKIAHYCLMDALACAFEALSYPACTKLLGPVVPGTKVPLGARVPGTDLELDPVQAAFDLGAMIRWLDYNDTWLAAEWGHPSDNLGGILAVADYVSRQKVKEGLPPLTMGDVLSAMIKAYEIQGVLGLENSFNRVGLDHVLLVKVASAAVVTELMGGNRDQIVAALSHAWLDGHALRCYRHYPNTGSRKSWAAGDATSRAVLLSLMVLKGETGYPTVLSDDQWGFYRTLFKGERFKLNQPYGSYVMENILFKAAFPAEFHAQTAAEAALKLHEAVRYRLEEIEAITITTQEPAIRIISKTGPLRNPADRDHCIQYITAVCLLNGVLTAEDYEDHAAMDPKIDELRSKTVMVENPQFTRDYYDPAKRMVTNAVQVCFKDGTSTPVIKVEYPLGHPKRRSKGLPLVKEKFKRSLNWAFNPARQKRILDAVLDQEKLSEMPVDRFMDLLKTDH